MGPFLVIFLAFTKLRRVLHQGIHLGHQACGLQEGVATLSIEEGCARLGIVVPDKGVLMAVVPLVVGRVANVDVQASGSPVEYSISLSASALAASLSSSCLT